MEKYTVIIPAAGQGKRMMAGKNKQLLELRGEPLIVHTVRFFECDHACDNIIIVANKDECNVMEELFKRYELKKVTAVIPGGKERQDSVYNGLSALKKEQIVLIHDGARPFLTKKMTARLVSKASEFGAATAAVQVKDTIKRVKNDIVIDTLMREELWMIQTPQAFKRSLLTEAHEKAKDAGFIGTDDASLVESLGHEVAVTEGDYHNIKLTTPEDLLFAEAIMQERERIDHD